MAIGTVTWASVVVGTTGNLSPAQPSPAAGNLLLCFAYDYAQLTSWTQPSGWSTLVNTATASGTYAVFYKVATGSEGTGTITVAGSGTGNSRLARICKVPGAGGQSADFIAGAAETETASPYSNAGVTPTVNDCLVVFFGGVRDCITNAETDGFGAVSGGTNVGTWTTVSAGTTGGSDAALGVGTAVQTTAAATGAISSTLQASQASYVGISYTFAVKPTSVRSGTTTSLTGTGSLGTAPGTKDVSSTVAALSGTGALGLSDGAKAISATVLALAASATLGLLDGYATTGEARSGTGVTLSGIAALSTADGYQGRLGTATALSGTGTLGAATGAKAASNSASALSGTGSLGAPTGAKAVSGTVAALSGTGGLGAATGSKGASGTVAALSGAGALGGTTGTKDVQGAASSLSGTGAYSTADGSASSVEERTGTALALSGSGAFGQADGSKAVDGAAATIAGSGGLGLADGSKAVSGDVADLAATGTLEPATGEAGELPTERSGAGAELAAAGSFASATGTPDRAGAGLDLSGAGQFASATGASGTHPWGAGLDLVGEGLLGVAEGFPIHPLLPAILLTLTDARQYVAQLADARALAYLTDARQYVAQLADARALAYLTDARQYEARFTVGGLPETMQGAVLVVPGRVPLITTTGRPHPGPQTGWFIGGYGMGPTLYTPSARVSVPRLARYVPGPNVPPQYVGYTDLLRVTDSLGDFAEMRLVTGGPEIVVPYPVPAVEMDVPIGSPGLGEEGELFTVVPSGLAIQFTATGGTGPYVWSVERNATGATIDQAGLYTAGATLEEDIVLVVDSLAVETRVTVGVPDDQVQIYIGGALAQGGVLRPSYAVRPVGGEAPYTVALVSTETGATITPANTGEVTFTLDGLPVPVLDGNGDPVLDIDGNPEHTYPGPIDLTGWTFEAELWSQRGGLLASGLAIAAPDATSRTVALPDPRTVALAVAVVAITATPPAGYPVLDLAVLLLSEA